MAKQHMYDTCVTMYSWLASSKLHVVHVRVHVHACVLWLWQCYMEPKRGNVRIPLWERPKPTNAIMCMVKGRHTKKCTSINNCKCSSTLVELLYYLYSIASIAIHVHVAWCIPLKGVLCKLISRLQTILHWLIDRQTHLTEQQRHPFLSSSHSS